MSKVGRNFILRFYRHEFHKIEHVGRGRGRVRLLGLVAMNADPDIRQAAIASIRAVTKATFRAREAMRIRKTFHSGSFRNVTRDWLSGECPQT